jgi:hypothetical protein
MERDSISKTKKFRFQKESGSKKRPWNELILKLKQYIVSVVEQETIYCYF